MSAVDDTRKTGFQRTLNVFFFFFFIFVSFIYVYAATYACIQTPHTARDKSEQAHKRDR